MAERMSPQDRADQLIWYRQGANGYVLSMGTKIWDPERSPEQGPDQTPEQGPEWKN